MQMRKIISGLMMLFGIHTKKKTHQIIIVTLMIMLNLQVILKVQMEISVYTEDDAGLYR